MASNPLIDYPEYLLAYSGTGTYEGWVKTIQDVFNTFSKKFDIAVARDRIAKMTMYWCIEVGASYRAPLAYHKFERCYTWPDFNTSFSDSWLVEEWTKKREEWRTIEQRRLELSRIPGISPELVIHDFYSRDVLVTLKEQCERRHGAEITTRNHGLFCNLISIYGSQSLSRLTESPVRSKPWLAPINQRDVIPNMLNTFWIEKYLNDTFGEDLIKYKKFTYDERKEEVKWLTNALTAGDNSSLMDTSILEEKDQDLSSSVETSQLKSATLIENTEHGDDSCQKSSKRHSKTSETPCMKTSSKKKKKKNKEEEKPEAETTQSEKFYCIFCGDEIEWAGKGRKPIKCKKDECTKAYANQKAAEYRDRDKK